MSQDLLHKYNIQDELINKCCTSTDLRKKLGDCAPSERTCRRIMAEWNKSKSLTEMDSKGYIDTDVHPTIPKAISSLRTDVRHLKHGVYVITCAQNSTQVNTAFLDNLMKYCEERRATLLVGGIAYGKDLVWHESVRDHLVLEPIKFGDDLIFCGELSINLTISDPLSALDAYTGEYSGIFSHPQVRLKSLPRFDGDPRFHYTTGCITQPNYIAAKAGYKARNKHKYAALVVEVQEDGSWFVRQLEADEHDGFYDLDEYYGKRPYGDWSCLSIVWGDLHFPNVAPYFWTVHKQMMSVLKPRYQVLHDVYDFHSRNHHLIHDQHDQYKKYINDDTNIQYEFNMFVKYLQDLDKTASPSVLAIVPSNHESAIERWLKSDAWKNDAENMEFYLWAQNIMYTGIRNSPEIPLLELLVQNWALHDHFWFLKEQEGLVLDGVQCGYHGHAGINGARGGVSQFIKTGVPTSLGHSHTACIYGNVYTAGTSTELRLNYNKGLTTWSNSHILQYNNGKRCIITTRGDKWRQV